MIKQKWYTILKTRYDGYENFNLWMYFSILIIFSSFHVYTKKTKQTNIIINLNEIKKKKKVRLFSKIHLNINDH